MDEKVIIKGRFTKTNILAFVFYAISIVSFIISMSLYIFKYREDFSILLNNWFWTVLEGFNTDTGVCIFAYLFVLFLILGTFYLLMMNACEITVTDKRVYGKAAFGKRVDLPLDKISSIGTNFPKGIKVATSSGAISFWLLANQGEVFTAISELLQNRQSASGATGNSSGSATDEIKKYKELLDQGVITQEEFDAKKKQLLGL